MLYRVTYYYIADIEDNDYVVVSADNENEAEEKACNFFDDRYGGELIWLETAEDGDQYVDLLTYNKKFEVYY